MDKTVKINIAGTLFQIETEAYYLLRNYLNDINNRLRKTPDGHETMEDIEARIAELFRSQKGISGVVSAENVKAVFEIIGSPDDFDQPEPAEEPVAGQKMKRRLYRNPDDSIIGGVCGGIGAFLGINAAWVRIGFLLLSLFYGVGFFIYIGLWIALPLVADNQMKRELYGPAFYAEGKWQGKGRKIQPSDYSDRENSSVARVINEIFFALGKLLHISARIILIILGASFILIGFSTLFIFILFFYLRHPGTLFSGTVSDTLFYMPDFLNLVVSPDLTPWVIALVSAVVIIPLLSLIIWGLKMIFRFRAKILVFSVSAFIIWIAALSALALILFSRGISFAEQGRAVEHLKISTPADTLYIKSGKSLREVDYKKEIFIPGGNYPLYFSEYNKSIFSKPEISFSTSQGSDLKVEVEKTMHGINSREASVRAKSLLFNYRLEGDTLFLDQYFEIPAGTRWSGAFTEVKINLPDGSIVWVDKELETSVAERHYKGIHTWDMGGRYWLWENEMFNPVAP